MCKLDNDFIQLCFICKLKIYFVSLVVVKIIKSFGFGPIYTNLIVTIVMAYRL